MIARSCVSRGDQRRGDIHQFRLDQPRMRIDPEPALALAAGQVQLPYPVQRQRLAERRDALASIAGIA